MGNRPVGIFLVVGMLVVGAVTVVGAVEGTAVTGVGEDAQASLPSETVVLESDNTSDLLTSEKDSIEYEFAGGFEERFIVEGYREGRLGPLPDVRVGETLRIPIRVSNTGDRTESYSLTLQENKEPIETKSGDLDPGEETEIEFAVAFDDADEEISELEIADWSTIVEIYDRDTMVLTDLDVSKSTAAAGEEVTVTATIENGNTPSSGTVDITNFNESIYTEELDLDAGETATVETKTTIEADYGASFSVEGDFVTGHYAEVKGEWEGNDTEWDFNDTDWNDSDWNDSDWNDSDWNDSEWNESDFNDSDWNDSDRNDSGWNTSDLNDSNWNNSDDNGADTESTTSVPGFGHVVASISFLAVALVLSWRR